MPRFTIDLPEETVARLKEIATRNHISQAEVIRRAFSLLSIASREKERDNRSSLAIIREDEKTHKQRIVARLVGIE
ncbi:MAG: Ribbon-helix-helix protein copG family [Pseudomonadota bacterium]|jgi:metal-responsive CopG/Arc/MetJ family transcriptional regulator